jgi:hypothetical protein
MLQNTEQNIRTVNYSDLIPGKVYLIQHSREGPQSQDYNTRFRGKFVRYEVGKQIGDPTGIRNLPQNLQVALFEDVEIISKNKEEIPYDIWIVSENPTSKKIRAKSLTAYMINDAYHNADDAIPNADDDEDEDDNDDDDLNNYITISDATRQMLEDIRNNNGQIAFDVNNWTFAESFKELENAMKQNILNHLGNDGPNPKDTREQQQLQIRRQQVFQEGGPGHDIADYAGFPFQKKSDPLQRNTSGTKRKYDEIGGRKRSRRNRRCTTRKGKSRKGKTRKSKSIKGKTRRGRRHYRK